MVLSKTFRTWLVGYSDAPYYWDIIEYAERSFCNLTTNAKIEIKRYVKEEIWGL